MKFYECDNCKQSFATTPPVEVHGIAGTSGSILVPTQMLQKHFCKEQCFWEWARKYDPNPLITFDERQHL